MSKMIISMQKFYLIFFTLLCSTCSKMNSEKVEKKKVLIGATGSVATIKIPDIISGINDCFKGHVEIKFVPTKNALHFLPQVHELEDKLGAKVIKDEDEWSSWNKRGDPVLHIELRKWADILIIGKKYDCKYPLV